MLVAVIMRQRAKKTWNQFDDEDATMAIPEVLFRDLMHRSWKNYLLIESIQREQEQKYGKEFVKKNGPYEVTQLINSFLGGFGLPREREIPDQLSAFTLTLAQRDWGFPQIENLHPGHLFIRDDQLVPTSEMNLNDLCKMIRNGIVHGNFTFGGYMDAFGDTQISDITIWNERGNKARTHNWGCRIDISDLRQVLSSFYDIATHIYQHSEDRRFEDTA